MAESYKQIIDLITGKVREDSVQRLSDGAQILAGGPEWVAYQKWLTQGNTPTTAALAPDSVPDLSVQLAAALINANVISADDLHPGTLADVNAQLIDAGQAQIATNEVKNEVA